MEDLVNEADDSTDQLEKPERSPFTCDKCTYQTKTKSSLQSHENKMHLEMNKKNRKTRG